MAMTNTLSGVQTAIAAAVNAITSASAAYNYSLNADMGYGVVTLDKVVGKLPEVFLSDITEETISESGGVEIMRATYTLVGIMNTDTSRDIGTDTMKMAADIQKAITTTQDLGAVVYRSKKETTEVVYYAEASKATVSLTFYSDYAVSTGTP